MEGLQNGVFIKRGRLQFTVSIGINRTKSFPRKCDMQFSKIGSLSVRKSMQHDLIFQPATQEDFEYIFNLCEVTMRGYVEFDLGDCFDEIARPTVSTLIKNALFQLVRIGNVRVGAIAIEELETHYQLEELYVEPSQQNRGIGTAIAQRIIEKACSPGKPIRLHVLASNPAVAFWSTLGFLVTISRKDVIFMEREQVLADVG